MGGGGKGGESGANEDLGKIAKQFFAETTPLRQETISQFLEALTTGGVGARIPIISKAQEQSRQATSNTLRGTDQQLAQSGLAGTPFGENIRAQTLQQGQQATAMVPIDIINQMLTQIPGFVTGSNQVVVSGLGQAADAQAQQAQQPAGLLGAIMSPFRFNFNSR